MFLTKFLQVCPSGGLTVQRNDVRTMQRSYQLHQCDIESPWLHTKHSYIESMLVRLLCFIDERTPFFFFS